MTNNSDRVTKIEALTESNAQAISDERWWGELFLPPLSQLRIGLADFIAATENLVSVANIHQQNFYQKGDKK